MFQIHAFKYWQNRGTTAQEKMKARFSFPTLDVELGTRKYANCNSLREILIIVIIVEPLALSIMEWTIC